MWYFVHIHSNVKFYADFCNCIHIFLRFLIYNLLVIFSKLVEAVLKVSYIWLGVLTIFMGKKEILVGKSNSSRHSVWEALDCKTVGFFFLKISKEIGKARRQSLTRAKRTSLTRPTGLWGERKKRLSPVSLSVVSLVPVLLFDCSRVLEDAKIRTVLQSFKTVQLIWVSFVAGRSRTALNCKVLCLCTRFPPERFL